MGYRFRRTRSVPKNVRKLAAEVLERAIKLLELNGAPLSADAVHDARTNLKKFRGLLRLARSGLGPVYEAANKDAREAAKVLSARRDNDASLEAIVRLKEDADEETVAAFEQLAATIPRVEASEAHVTAGELDSVLKTLHRLHEECSAWNIPGRDFRVLEEGLYREYRSARKRHSRLDLLAPVADWHEFRKRVKNHWYHMRLLAPMWSTALGARFDELKRLSEIVGDEHDLSLVEGVLERDGGELGFDEAARIQRAIDATRDRLRGEALTLGALLFAESPEAIVQRMHRYWEIWRQV